MKRTKIQIEFGWADTTLNLHIEPGASDEEIDALVVNVHEGGGIGDTHRSTPHRTVFYRLLA